MNETCCGMQYNALFIVDKLKLLGLKIWCLLFGRNVATTAHMIKYVSNTM